MLRQFVQQFAVDQLYSGYGRQNVPDQRRILREGNA